LSTLVSALKIADLVKGLDCHSSCSRLTVFAPTNSAFAALPSALVTKLTTEPQYSEHLKQLLQYHLLNAVYYSTFLTKVKKLKTAQGESINVTVSGNNVFINSNAQVIKANINATNGVIHVINNVLVPGFLQNNLVAVAASNPQFSTLVTAVTTAKLVGVLSGAGPFTIFAPNNAAFNKLGKSTIDSLLADTTKLAKILKYHVVAGIVPASKLQKGGIKTVEGQNITVRIGGNVTLNGNSRVISTNILASNGIIHVIVSFFLFMVNYYF
jgi:transforming growth factor-beta-induced protein